MPCCETWLFSARSWAWWLGGVTNLVGAIDHRHRALGAAVGPGVYAVVDCVAQRRIHAELGDVEDRSAVIRTAAAGSADREVTGARDGVRGVVAVSDRGAADRPRHFGHGAGVDRLSQDVRADRRGSRAGRGSGGAVDGGGRWEIALEPLLPILLR